jgi:hypothetical protein
MLTSDVLKVVAVVVVIYVSWLKFYKQPDGYVLETFNGPEKTPKMVADIDKQFREAHTPLPKVTRDPETGRVNQPEMLQGLQRELAPLLFKKYSPLCCPSYYTTSLGCICDKSSTWVDFTKVKDDGAGNGQL